MKRLAIYLKPYKKELIVGPFFKLLEAIFELIIPIVMAYVIDVGIKNGDTGYILRLCGLMILLAAAGLGSAFICQYSASVASQGYGTTLRDTLFSHIGKFSYAELDRFGASSLSNRIINDVAQLQLAVAMLIRLAIRAPFLCIGGFISALIIDAKLAIVLAVAIPIFIIILAIIMNQSVKLYRLVQKKLDAIALVAGENLSGVRVIRAFARVSDENKRFATAAEEHTKTAERVSRLAVLSNPATTLIMNFAILGILWFGGKRVSIGGMTQGEVIAFTNYMSQILMALIVVANLVVIFTKAIASGGRVNQVLDTKPSLTSPADARKMDFSRMALTFDHVNFAYEGQTEPVLTDISFSLQPGETAGIIGLTGSGKSTLINLIGRFYDATAGSVRINGENVQDLDLDALRSAIGIVPQKTTLFSGTIRSNLTMGSGSIPQEQLQKAVRIAQAEEFVSRLPDGLDSRVDRGGQNLSGGQRQRISIARALAKNPALLILDDASSALDFATEARLRKALREELDELTVLIISQRVSSVRHADKILVLEDGKMSAMGTHDELLATNPIYQQICASQEVETDEAK